MADRNYIFMCARFVNGMPAVFVAGREHDGAPIVWCKDLSKALRFHSPTHPEARRVQRHFNKVDSRYIAGFATIAPDCITKIDPDVPDVPQPQRRVLSGCVVRSTIQREQLAGSNRMCLIHGLAEPCIKCGEGAT